ncbi:hypothetical protein P691DRAFT_646551, partial [Macrolepiota fuliginosa MF-IS2]
YTITDLEILVEQQAAIPMQDRLQFSKYYWNFITKSSWLIDQGLILQREQNKLFLSGFHINIHEQLHLTNPNHPLNNPWPLSETKRAARFLLNGDNTTTLLALPTLASTTTQQFPTTSTAPAPRETFNMMSIEQHAAPAQPAGQQQCHPLTNCGGCSDPNHFFRACPKMANYLQRGVCICDNSNCICFLDGTLVTPQAAPGKNLTERINNWH